MKSFLGVPILLCLTGCTLAQKSVSDLFQIGLTDNNQGGCSYVPFMQSLIQDSYDLAGIGVQLCADYGNNVPEARRLLDSWFKISTPPMTAAQLSAISSSYAAVRNWLATGGSYNGGTRTGKPYLFCYHNWLEKHSMSDEAMDVEGETFPNVFTGEPALMNQIDDYIETQAKESSYLGKRVQAVPYWSLKHNAYIFDRSYGGATSGYCSRTGNDAATQHRLPVSTITLCPMSFGANAVTFSAANLGTVSYVGRGAVAPNPIPRANIASAQSTNQKMSTAMAPRAVTLFHELFHLVLGNEESYPPDVGEVYDIFSREEQIVGLDYQYAAHNPESYALAAVAYDYTLNWPANANGDKVEFYAGWTTQG